MIKLPPTAPSAFHAEFTNFDQLVSNLTGIQSVHTVHGIMLQVIQGDQEDRGGTIIGMLFVETKQRSLESGPRFNIKMSSYPLRKSHCGDQTVVRSSYLHNGISYTGKMSSLYWIRAQMLPSVSQTSVIQLKIHRIVVITQHIHMVKIIYGKWEWNIFSGCWYRRNAVPRTKDQEGQVLYQWLALH